MSRKWDLCIKQQLVLRVTILVFDLFVFSANVAQCSLGWDTARRSSRSAPRRSYCFPGPLCLIAPACASMTDYDAYRRSHDHWTHKIPMRTHIQDSKCDWAEINGHSNVQTCSPGITRCVSAPREIGVLRCGAMFIWPFPQIETRIRDNTTRVRS